jgi:ferredoxin-thioredoxin reductase catalytic subunit
MVSIKWKEGNEGYMNLPLAEIEKTRKFVGKVWDKMGYSPNPDEEINENIIMGLTQMQVKHGKRYCPCFTVVGETKEEQKAAAKLPYTDPQHNRVCPCKPALKEEIPNEGVCHCGIFCSQEYVEENS